MTKILIVAILLIVAFLSGFALAPKNQFPNSHWQDWYEQYQYMPREYQPDATGNIYQGFYNPPCISDLYYGTCPVQGAPLANDFDYGTLKP